MGGSLADTCHVSERVRPFEGAPSLSPPRGVRRPWPWPHRIVFGLLVAVCGLLVWREFVPLLRFRPVDGVVVYSDVDAVRTADSRGSGRGYRTRYVPSVTYSYVVGGESYLGARYARFTMAGTRARALREARRFIRGTRVQVWYDPSRPADAVLSRRPNPVMLGVLSVVVFMAWLFVMAALATRRRPADPGSCWPGPSLTARGSRSSRG